MNPVFLILPCFNEEEALPHFFRELATVLESIPDHLFFTVWVDDGSSDATWKVIGTLPESSRIRHHGVSFVRNYGHQSAIQAGCDFVAQHPAFTPEARILILDSDGQHPVTEIPRMLRELELSRHVQMLRKDTAGIGRAKKSSSSLFYWAFRTFSGMDLPDGAADFRGLRGAALLNYLRFNESGRFNRGLFHLAEPPFFSSL